MYVVANAGEFIVNAINFTVKVFDYCNARDIASAPILIIARLRFLTRRLVFLSFSPADCRQRNAAIFFKFSSPSSVS